MAEDPKIIDLDDQVEEFFLFKLKGNTYSFRQPTTDELEELSKVEDGKDFKKQRELFYPFITPVKADSPTFPSIVSKLNMQHWLRFFDMLKTKLGLNDGNS